MRKILFGIALLVASFVLERPVWAQQQENLDLGNVVVGLSASTPAGLGVYNSADILSSSNRGVQCFYNQVQGANNPLVTISLQGKDSVSSSYYNILSSSVISGSAVLMAYPGIAGSTGLTSAVPFGSQPASILPAGWAVAGIHLPRLIRVQVVVGGGSTATVEATVGCNLLT